MSNRIKEKLQIFREKVQNTIVFSNDFKRLLGIELYDFIHANDALKKEFYRRADYLFNLATDGTSDLLQDKLFQLIQEHLKLISLEYVEERQREWDNKVVNRLKSRDEKDFISLPELYSDLQDKNNYYTLIENSYYAPLEGEISTRTHVVPVMKQYQANVEFFFNQVFDSNYFEKLSEKEVSQLLKLSKGYKDAWYRLEEIIYRIPINLHLQDFEKFHSTCIRFHPRKGLEFHYNFFSGSQVTEKQFRKIKQATTTVLDDLLGILEDNGEKPRDKKPFDIIKDDNSNLLFQFKNKKFIFGKKTLAYYLVKFVLDNYNENNAYLIKDAKIYITDNYGEWSDKITNITNDIARRQGKLFKIDSKGKTFQINEDL